MNQIGGMSDLCTYELEDIAWDELDQIDDHIVPHPSNKNGNETAYQENSFKKLRHDVIGVSTKHMNQVEEGSIQPQKKKRIKLSEKDSGSHSVESSIADSRDSSLSRETTTVSSDSVRILGQYLKSPNIDTMDADFGADAAIAGEGCTVNDTKPCVYSLDDMSLTGNDLSFWDNDRKDNETADLLYYGWPDIEIFDDVERMFRSCDSTVEFGGSNEDNLSWLSSIHNIEDSKGFLKPDSGLFKDLPEQNLLTLKKASSSANDSNLGSSCITCKSGYQGFESGEADPLDNLTFIDGSVVSDRKEEFTPKEQQGVQFSSTAHFNNSIAYQSISTNGQRVKFQKKQATRPNPSEGRKKDQYKFRQVNPHPDHQKHKKNIALNTFGYLHTPTPYMHVNYMHPSDQISVGSQLSGIKSEINNLTSLSPRESSYASNQSRSMESSHCHPFGAPVMSVDDKLEKLRRRQGFYHPSVSKLVHHSQIYSENHCGVERDIVTNPSNIDSTNAPESSCKSTGFDEISLEASSFRQLQQVMEQLDLRTKLCIRDSLYRLARSAEQRHRYANMRGGGQSGEDGNAFVADGSDNGFMDMETDTNPIDRSVAHLLFHRPSDPSIMPAHDGSSLKSHTMIHGTIAGPTVNVKQLVSQEEAASEGEKTVSITDDG